MTKQDNRKEYDKLFAPKMLKTYGAPPSKTPKAKLVESEVKELFKQFKTTDEDEFGNSFPIYVVRPDQLKIFEMYLTQERKALHKAMDEVIGEDVEERDNLLGALDLAQNQLRHTQRQSLKELLK